jgi:hypothetical protein
MSCWCLSFAAWVPAALKDLTHTPRVYVIRRSDTVLIFAIPVTTPDFDRIFGGYRIWSVHSVEKALGPEHSELAQSARVAILAFQLRNQFAVSVGKVAAQPPKMTRRKRCKAKPK